MRIALLRIFLKKDVLKTATRIAERNRGEVEPHFIGFKSKDKYIELF